MQRLKFSQTVVAFVIAVLGMPVLAQDNSSAPPVAARDEVASPYVAVPNWFKGDPVEAGRLIYPLSVYAQSADRIFIVLSGTSPKPPDGTPWYYGDINPKVPGTRINAQIIVVNRQGKVIGNWSRWSSLLNAHGATPHFIRINPYDPQKHVWVLDRLGMHGNFSKGGRIFEFTNDGKKLVRTLGTPEHGTDDSGCPGSNACQFGEPADIAWLPDGTFFVADGYANQRVVKFDKNGKYLLSWGTKGHAPGQFAQTVHSVTVDSKHRVYVADRQGQRIQVFDENGRFLDEWTHIGDPTTVHATRDNFVWVSSGNAPRLSGGGRLLKFDLDGYLAGSLITSWGTTPGENEQFMDHAHDFGVDDEGNIYIVASVQHEVQKFIPKKNADPLKLVRPLYVGTE